MGLQEIRRREKTHTATRRQASRPPTREAAPLGWMDQMNNIDSASEAEAFRRRMSRRLQRPGANEAAPGSRTPSGRNWIDNAVRNVGAAGARARDGAIFAGVNNVLGAIDGAKNVVDQLGAWAGQEREIRDAIAAAQIAVPGLDQYMAPFDQAETAANASAEAGRGVIGSAYDELGTDLETNQAEFGADQAAIAERQARERRLMEQETARNSNPSGLARELGVAGDLEGEQGLLDALSSQGNQSADNLTQRMEQSQAQDFNSRVEGVGASEAAALANTQANLQALLGQIGLGRADAQRQHASDAAGIQRQNADAARQIRQEFQDQQQQEQQDQDDWRNEQAGLLKGAEEDPWDGEAFDRRVEANPKATSFFMSMIDDLGGKRNRRTAAKAKGELDNYLQQYREEAVKAKVTPTNFNKKVLLDWIDDYFSDRRIINEKRFFQSGGDPQFLAEAYG